MPHTPRIVIHGGAGSISRTNLPPGSEAYTAFTASLRHILTHTHTQLLSGASALDAATAAVVLFEDNPLFNCGKGAVFTRAGHNELEASIMLSRGAHKRGVGVALLRHVKNPITLARELLLREEEVVHNYLSGETAEELAKKWGCEIVGQEWFWTEKRWRDHLRGLEPRKEEGEYQPQGTVGVVVMDREGVLCAATSTGGLTNKLPGRIGDTPTPGAGFWAEEWKLPVVGDGLLQRLGVRPPTSGKPKTRAVAMSGTGNGDYFLRLGAAHSVAARCRFGGRPLGEAVAEVVGRGGEMQRAAGERWGTGEGDGGIIAMDQDGTIVCDLNCGGMFRGFVDDAGNTKVAVFWDEEMT